MKTEYAFYEVVRVVSTSPDKQKIRGLEGAILGKSKNDKGEWGYAVYIYELSECWDLMHDELEDTGKMDQRENFYDGTRVKVTVDPVTGEGRIVDSNSIRREKRDK